MFRGSSELWSFVCGVALVAAAIGDAFVETISNAGVVGGGYRDDVHAAVVPAFVVGCLFLIAFVAARCVAIVRRGPRGSHGDWLARVARDASVGHPLRVVPALLGVQFAALYAMEATEDVCSGGHLPLGLAWLGGPPLFGFVVHVALGVVCAVLLAACLRSIARTIASAIVRTILAIATSPRSAHSITFARADAPRSSTARHARPFGGRAPPRYLTLANS